MPSAIECPTTLPPAFQLTTQIEPPLRLVSVMPGTVVAAVAPPLVVRPTADPAAVSVKLAAVKPVTGAEKVYATLSTIDRWLPSKPLVLFCDTAKPWLLLESDGRLAACELWTVK